MYNDYSYYHNDDRDTPNPLTLETLGIQRLI